MPRRASAAETAIRFICYAVKQTVQISRHDMFEQMDCWQAVSGGVYPGSGTGQV